MPPSRQLLSLVSHVSLVQSGLYWHWISLGRPKDFTQWGEKIDCPGLSIVVFESLYVLFMKSTAQVYFAFLIFISCRRLIGRLRLFGAGIFQSWPTGRSGENETPSFLVQDQLDGLLFLGNLVLDMQRMNNRHLHIPKTSSESEYTRKIPRVLSYKAPSMYRGSSCKSDM